MAVNGHDQNAPHADDARIASLYRSAAIEEPPERLERLINDEARRALQPTTSRAPRQPWWWTWRAPFAAAAVAVLSVSVVIVTQREGGEPLTLKAPAPEAQPRASELETRAPPPPPAVEANHRADLPDRREQPEDRLSKRAFSAAEASRQSSDAPKASEGASVGAAPPSKQEAPAENRTRAAEPVAGEARGLRDSAASGERMQRESEFSTERRAVDREQAPAQAPAPPAKALEAPAAPRALAKPAPAAPASTAAARQEAPIAASTSSADLIAELERRPAAQWLERIVALRAQGRREDADVLLAEFKRRFPEEPLPTELR